MSTTMKLADLLRDYKDGDATGWPAEFAWLWQKHGRHMLGLTQDIAGRGIQEPVTLGSDGRVWDGHHRNLSRNHRSSRPRLM